MDFDENFRLNLRLVLKSRHGSSQELATNTGLTPTFISMITCGRKRASLKTAAMISSALRLRLDFLTERTTSFRERYEKMTIQEMTTIFHP